MGPSPEPMVEVKQPSSEPMVEVQATSPKPVLKIQQPIQEPLVELKEVTPEPKPIDEDVTEVQEAKASEIDDSEHPKPKNTLLYVLSGATALVACAIMLKKWRK